MDFSHMTIVVAGLGLSGQGAAQALVDRAGRVITVDERNARADLHSFDDIDWRAVDLLVVSPVFNPRTPFIRKAQSLGIRVIGEVELAWRLRADNIRTGAPAPWIGITGTNGKTSTTQMVASMLTACGMDAPAVGNIGRSLSLAAVEGNHDVLCVELSSFQMHFTDSLALDCAAITNIAADHLDWHGGMERYAADKAKVFNGVRKVLVYNADDERVSHLAHEARTAPECRKVGFTLHEPEECQIGIKDAAIVDMSGLAGAQAGVPLTVAQLGDFPHLCEPDGSAYPHLLADALTALALVLGLGADMQPCLRALQAFAPGDHRIETVAVAQTGSRTGTVEGTDAVTVDTGTLVHESKPIRFVDDSKATNASAAEASLASFPDHSVIWIAGGLAKGGRFENLVKAQARKIKAAVIIGVNQEPLLQAFAASAPQIPVMRIDPNAGEGKSIMQRAVEVAGTYAQAGDVVLMAPACASMDQFKSYADRGDQFAQSARRWVIEHE